MNKKKGFTLIELLITLSVFAIISSIALPSLFGMFQKQNLNKSTQELRTVLTEARGKAVLQRTNVEVVLNSSLENTRTQLNWAPSGKSVLKSGPTKIVFQLNGALKENSDQNFEICDSATAAKESKKIGISRMGVIQSITEGTC